MADHRPAQRLGGAEPAAAGDRRDGVVGRLERLTSGVDAVHLAAAWTFVGFRVLHSAVHCTINIVMLRFTLYLISTLSVWFIAARTFLHYVGAAEA